MKRQPNHRGVGGKKRDDPTKCVRSHDLTDPANVYVDSAGGVHCRACRREREQRTEQMKREAGSQRSRLFISCGECGRDKYPDRRRLCFRCAHEASKGRPSTVDATLQRAVEAENLMPWERTHHEADHDRSGARTERPQADRAGGSPD